MVYHFIIYIIPILIPDSYPKTTKTRPSNTCSASCSAPGTTDQASSPSITQKSAGQKRRRNAFSGPFWAAKEIASSQKVATFWPKKLENKSGKNREILRGF